MNKLPVLMFKEFNITWNGAVQYEINHMNERSLSAFLQARYTNATVNSKQAHSWFHPSKGWFHINTLFHFEIISLSLCVMWVSTDDSMSVMKYVVQGLTPHTLTKSECVLWVMSFGFYTMFIYNGSIVVSFLIKQQIYHV